MEIIIAAIMFIGAGIAIGTVISYERPIGNLRIDHFDPTCEPYLFLELNTDVYTILRKKCVTLDVKIEDFLPHE